MIELTVNGRRVSLPVDPETPLLWVLRDHLGLTGTKYGCGAGRCGACTVHLDGEATRSCVLPVGKAADREVATIEGLGAGDLHPVQRAWVLEDVSQCGYCQPGQIMTAAALLRHHPDPDDARIDEAMAGVLCRCGTYRRVRRAIHRAADLMRTGERPELPPGPSLGPGLVTGAARQEPPDTAAFAPNPWVRVAADGTVVIRVAKAEMGQGVLTPLAAAVADELEADWARVRIESAPAEPAYEDPAMGAQLTGGSTSTRHCLATLRRAGAQAREALVGAAARAWGVDPATCAAREGWVRHGPSGRERSYADLAPLAAAVPLSDSPALKGAEDLRLLGRPLPRADARPKAEGAARFGLDAPPRGRLVAVVARSATFGGRVREWDDRRAREVPGFRAALAVPSGVAAVADSTWAALRARDALTVAWEEPPRPALDDAAVDRALAEALDRPGRVAEHRGDARAALAAAATVIEAEYAVPFLAHAPLEPMNAAAEVADGACTVWVATQAQTGARRAAARAAGVDVDRVRVHTPFLGGGFGRRLETDYAAEAAAVARELAQPVQVFWSRGDDLAHDAYRPAARHRLRATLGPDGLPTAWLHRIAAPAIQGGGRRGRVDPAAVEGAAPPAYAVDHLRVEWSPCELGVPTGYWRSVGHSHTAFAVESFVDELAHAAGLDPLELRLRLLRDAPRHRAVLERAAEEAGWGHPLPDGTGRGIAVHESFGSVVAQVAEVRAGDDGFRVLRVVCAAHCGPVASPDGVAAQLEGAVVFGLSAALHEAISLEQGGVAQENFGAYRLLTFPEAPVVEVHLVDGEEPMGGAGEPGVPPVAAAVANALFAATGERRRRLPLASGG